MTGRDQLVHLTIEKAQQQRPDVAPIDIRIRHDDDLVIPPLRQILIGTDPGPDGLDHRLHFLVGKNLVFAALVSIDDFSPQRQDRLVIAHPTSLGGTAR